MTTSTKKWIPVVVFWCVFLASVGVVDRFAWVGSAWIGLLALFIVAGSVHSVLHIRKDKNGALSYGGYPRWWVRFALDEGEGKRNRR